MNHTLRMAFVLGLVAGGAPAWGQDLPNEDVDRIVKTCFGSFASEQRTYSMSTSLGRLEDAEVLVLEDEICEKSRRNLQVSRFKTFCRKDAWLTPLRIDYTFETHLPKEAREKKGLQEKVSIGGTIRFADGKAAMKVLSIEGVKGSEDPNLSEKSLLKLFERDQKLETVDFAGAKIEFRTTEPALLRAAFGSGLKEGALFAFVLPEDVVVKLRHASIRTEDDGAKSVSFSSVSFGASVGGGKAESHLTPAKDALLGVRIKDGRIADLTWRRQVLAPADPAKIAEFKRLAIESMRN